MLDVRMLDVRIGRMTVGGLKKNLSKVKKNRGAKKN
jgi:hypothetical protein